MNAEQFSNALGKVNDKYIMEAITYKKKKKSDWLKWGTIAACFGLILTAALVTMPGILKGPGGAVLPPSSNVPGPAVSDGDKQPNTDPLQPPDGQNIIINWDHVIVNESKGLAPDYALRYYDPALYDTASWGMEEVRAYYGWELSPAYIPDGLTGGGNTVAGSIVREKATGEIVQDQAGRGFWSEFREDGSPKSDDDIVIPTGFTIVASRLGILHCCLLPVDEERTTDFGGVPVTLNHVSLPYGPFDPEKMDPSGLYHLPAGYYDIYTAFFTLNGVEYEITAQRLELEEVIEIAASMINMPYSADFTVGNNLLASPNEEEKSHSTPVIPNIGDSSNNSAAGQGYSVGEPHYEDREFEAEGSYDDPNNPVAEQNYRVGEPQYEDSEPKIEGCYDDPNNPVAEQNYSVGKPHYE